MTELSERTRRALAEYRATPAVGDADKARMWSRLQDAVAAGADGAEADADPDDGAATVDLRPPVDVSRTVWRIGVAIAAAAAVLLLIRAVRWRQLGADAAPDPHADEAMYGVGSDDRPPMRAQDPVREPGAEPQTPGETRSLAEPSQAAAPPDAEPAPTPSADPATSRPAARASDRTVRPSPPAAPPSVAADPLREEIELLNRARQGLARGDAAAASAALDAHARRFPRGQMREDRAALRPQVLCAAGKSRQALKAANAFTRAFPQSAHAEKVRGVAGRAARKHCPGR